MRKILLGTSALCALAAFGSGPAVAQEGEPIKLGIGGYYRAGYGYIVSQNGLSSRGRRRDDIIVSSRIRFEGSTKLDNGLTAGVSIQMNGVNSRPSVNNTQTGGNGFINNVAQQGDVIVKDYAFFRGKFGQFRIGDDDSAERQKDFTAPEVGDLFGANTPTLTLVPTVGGINTNTTQRWLTNDKRATEIIYFSPTIAGFSLAVSYTPGGEKGGVGTPIAPSCNQFGTATLRCPAFNNIVSVAVDYAGKFAGFEISAYAAGTSANRGTNPGHAGGPSKNNPLSASGGLIIGYGGFKVGVVDQYIIDLFQPGANDSTGTCVGAGGTTACQRYKSNVINAGISYETGPFGVALDWTEGVYDGFERNASPRLHSVALGTNYILGPGIALGFGVMWNHYNNHIANSTNTTPGVATGTATAVGDFPYTGVNIFAGTAINF